MRASQTCRLRLLVLLADSIISTDLYIDDKFGWRACVRMRKGRGGQFDGVIFRNVNEWQPGI